MFCKLNSSYEHCSKDCTETYILNNMDIECVSYGQPQQIVELKWGGGVVGRIIITKPGRVKSTEQF